MNILLKPEENIKKYSNDLIIGCDLELLKSDKPKLDILCKKEAYNKEFPNKKYTIDFLKTYSKSSELLSELTLGIATENYQLDDRRGQNFNKHKSNILLYSFHEARRFIKDNKSGDIKAEINRIKLDYGNDKIEEVKELFFTRSPNITIGNIEIMNAKSPKEQLVSTAFTSLN